MVIDESGQAQDNDDAATNAELEAMAQDWEARHTQGGDTAVKEPLDAR